MEVKRGSGFVGKQPGNNNNYNNSEKNSQNFNLCVIFFINSREGKQLGEQAVEGGSRKRG